MKLSQLSTQDKIKLAAELDGWKLSKKYPETVMTKQLESGFLRESHIQSASLKSYATSYDAIIPLIQKQTISIQEDVLLALVNEFNTSIKHGTRFGDFTEWRQQTIIQFSTTPSQLLDALLVATGKTEL